MKATLILTHNNLESEEKQDAIIYNLAVKNNYCVFHKKVNENNEVENIFTFENLDLLNDFVNQYKRFVKRYEK